MASKLKLTLRTSLIAVIGTVAISACSNSDTDNGAATLDTEVAVDASGPALGEIVNLAEVCFSPIVVQTDWYPQTEHGGIYELLGDDYVVDAARGATTGSLVFDGVDTGVDLEIRAGGPFIESPVVTEMFLDGSIMFGYVGTDVAISRYAETPTLAVFNALTINPQVILWDATKHPKASTIADIAQDVAAVSVFGDRPYMRFLVELGVVPAVNVDTNY